MIKKLYYDSFQELVQDEYGWCYRELKRNRFGSNWTKWYRLGDLIKTHEEEVEWENTNGNLLHDTIISYYFKDNNSIFRVMFSKNDEVKEGLEDNHYRLPKTN